MACLPVRGPEYGHDAPEYEYHALNAGATGWMSIRHALYRYGGVEYHRDEPSDPGSRRRIPIQAD
jgi:hypothetical protein